MAPVRSNTQNAAPSYKGSAEEKASKIESDESLALEGLSWAEVHLSDLRLAKTIRMQRAHFCTYTSRCRGVSTTGNKDLSRAWTAAAEGKRSTELLR